MGRGASTDVIEASAKAYHRRAEQAGERGRVALASVAPFRGLDVGHAYPRLTPWANICRPFGTKERALYAAHSPRPSWREKPTSSPQSW